ncbi:MAG: AAA family ATPase [Chitinophagales bacterium]
MSKFQKLPTTESGFEAIREDGLLYVDKTKQMLTLLNTGRYLFLSRPRRFGKSMLVNTLEALYQGKKHLFEGLYVYDKWEWKEYPVIRLDFSGMHYSNDQQTFEDSINTRLEWSAKKYDIELSKKNYKDALSELLQLLYGKIGQKVVVLVDEYDKPITDFINNPIKAEENRRVLKEFYTSLKAEHNFLEKVFITGVSKLAKVSVFSGMNNVDDLSLMPELNDVVGLTQEDVENSFADYLGALQQKFNFSSHEDLMKAVKHWYNGYSWDGINKVYNPYSIVHLCNRLEFKNYWYKSGTPTLLIDLIIQRARMEDNALKKEPTAYENVKVTEEIFDAAELENLSVEGLLFQTGYLTITDIGYEDLTSYYRLNYPNHEVRWSFAAHIIQEYAKMPRHQIQTGALMMHRALRMFDKAMFLKLLRSYFAVIPYQLRESANEAYYHSLFQMVFTLIGIEMLSERSTIDGRIDGVIEFDDKLYIVEFKFARKGTMEKLMKRAMLQIKEKGYADGYAAKNKTVYLLGVGFLEKKEKGMAHTKLEIDCVIEEWREMDSVNVV